MGQGICPCSHGDGAEVAVQVNSTPFLQESEVPLHLVVPAVATDHLESPAESEVPEKPEVPITEEWDVVINHDADIVDCRTGKRMSIALDREFVHGNAYSHLVDEKRAKSRHHNQDSPFGFEQATAIVHRAQAMAAEVAGEKTDMTHDKWRGPSGRDPLEALFDQSDMDALADAVQANAEACHEAVLAGPTMNEIRAPAKVFGDLHGQLRDLLLFFHHYGFPSFDGPCFVFNGDWVDRGSHQVEVLSLIYAVRLAFPRHVFLNRGNHEDKVINRHMGKTGFEQACMAKFGKQRGKKLFLSFAKSFEALPLATIIAEKILVVHGGIGSGDWDLEKIRNTKRPLTSKALGDDEVLYNLLWSDPVDEDQRDSFGVHDSPRDDHNGLVKEFGQDVTEKFLARNNLRMIIRSHQSQTDGDGYEVMHGGKLIRVFSARDYDEEDNDGSIIAVDLVPAKREVVCTPQCLQSAMKRREGEPAAPQLV